MPLEDARSPSASLPGPRGVADNDGLRPTFFVHSNESKPGTLA